ncbi:Threonine dehydrogenase [Minicystis rosea]|nr:Threonine dehydrogenase [Minicystis rosea]
MGRPRIEPGGLAEYVRIRPPLVSHIRPIPEGVSHASAAYTEIVACAAESIVVGGVSFGDTVVVVGCGPVALLQIQLARLRGATQVLCLYNHPERREALVRAGAEPVDVLEGRVEERVKRLTGNRGADVVLEAAGRAETYTLALRLVRPGGAVVGFGGCRPGTTLTFDPNDLHYNGIRFIGSYHYAPGMFERALRLIASGRVDVESILTHRLPLAHIAEAPAVAGAADCFALIINP